MVSVTYSKMLYITQLQSGISLVLINWLCNNLMTYDSSGSSNSGRKNNARQIKSKMFPAAASYRQPRQPLRHLSRNSFLLHLTRPQHSIRSLYPRPSFRPSFPLSSPLGLETWSSPYSAASATPTAATRPPRSALRCFGWLWRHRRVRSIPQGHKSPNLVEDFLGYPKGEHTSSSEADHCGLLSGPIHGRGSFNYSGDGATAPLFWPCGRIEVSQPTKSFI